ncbi:MAG: hypothetical protein H6718_33785 [Polyangiaceae bacterium]|nr:hypothetical protein [Polyangiaceae bacterium]MCB9608424.1 hypothetical protein [Polyangiaceae bacterium]
MPRLSALLAVSVCCGCNALGGSSDRAPSPSAVTEPAPRALGAHAASELPIDGGTVGRLPAPQDPLAPEDSPPDATPAVPPLEVPDAGVAL